MVTGKSIHAVCVFCSDGYNPSIPTAIASACIVSTLYEIIELPSGEIVLQRVTGDAEPLVRIRFSDQARAYIDDASLLIAKAMVEAGIKAINDLGHAQTGEEKIPTRPRQLH